MGTETQTKTAEIYRLVTLDHVCPYGLKSLDLLEREGYEVDDHLLETEEEATAFREKWDVETNPQTLIDGELVGTLDDLRALRYSYVYPYAEAGAGLLMIPAVLNWGRCRWRCSSVRSGRSRCSRRSTSTSAN